MAEQYKSKFTGEELDTILTDAGDLADTVGELDQKITVTNTKIITLQSDAGTVRTDLDALQTTANALSSNIGEVNTKISTLQTDANGLRTDVNASSSAIAALQTGKADKSEIPALEAGTNVTINKNESTNTYTINASGSGGGGGDIAGAIAEHNTSGTAHADIRALIGSGGGDGITIYEEDDNSYRRISMPGINDLSLLKGKILFIKSRIDDFNQSELQIFDPVTNTGIGAQLFVSYIVDKHSPYIGFPGESVFMPVTEVQMEMDYGGSASIQWVSKGGIYMVTYLENVPVTHHGTISGFFILNPQWGNMWNAGSGGLDPHATMILNDMAPQGQLDMLRDMIQAGVLDQGFLQDLQQMWQEGLFEKLREI